MTQPDTATTRPADDQPSPVLRPDSRMTPALLGEYVDSGSWRPETLRSLLSGAAAEQPDRVAAIDRAHAPEVERLTWAELDERAHRFACGLHQLGVRRGDSVAVMLPNCIDFAALIFAITEVGAIYSGIPAAYGEREVEVILRRTGASGVVATESFGSNRPLELVTRLRPQMPSLRHVVVAGSSDRDGLVPLGSLLDAPDVDLPEVDPQALCHVGFTSGTTGEPKGVMNTHQTLRAVLDNWVRHAGRESLGDPAVNLIASPIGHHTGFLWGVLLTALLRGTGVYLDRWDPAAAAHVILDEGVTTMFSAPTFLQDLLRTDLVEAPGTPLHTMVLAGAPVPRRLPVVAGEALGCYVCPAWGMTELGIGISCAPHLPQPAQETDGVAVPGTDVRVVGPDGAPAAPGVIGDLQIRGPGLFLGYLDLPDVTATEIDPEGWFATGDTARVSEEGYISLEGRTKDIVIRGGENIPVAVVESMLFDHPDVVEASVIGVPDERLGERACAVVAPRDGADLTLEALCTFLLERGLSRHFLPERLELVAELPKTPSGKIRKVELRSRYRS